MTLRFFTGMLSKASRAPKEGSPLPDRLRIMVVFGTRPEAVKMAPVVGELRRRPERAEIFVCATAQHREMLDQVTRIFDIVPDRDLDLMRPGQGLADLTAMTVRGLDEPLGAFSPDVVLVQGDTTTAMIAALASFYRRIPVGHVEAGLRTGDPYRPFPEEMNRRLITCLASWHFAPTASAAAALRACGAREDAIHLTGNTVIDALRQILARFAQDVGARSDAARALDAGVRDDASPEPSRSLDAETREVGASPTEESGGRASDPTTTDEPLPGDGRAEPSRDPAPPRLVLVTAHRRESFGRPFEDLCRALRELAERVPDIEIVYPVHLNPNVREPVRRILGEAPRVQLIEPLEYVAFVRLMARATLILTDSGGIQEEAPALGVPVLVMREETERPEAIEAGVARLVGTDTRRIVSEAVSLLRDEAARKRMIGSGSPFGDGHAAERIVKVLLDGARYPAPRT